MKNARKAEKLIKELCDGDHRHPMADQVNLEFMQSLHAISLVDTQSGYGYQQITNKIGEVVH